MYLLYLSFFGSVSVFSNWENLKACDSELEFTDYRIKEYSKLEETHKDHEIQLLSEWPTWGLNPQPWHYELSQKDCHNSLIQKQKLVYCWCSVKVQNAKVKVRSWKELGFELLCCEVSLAFSLQNKKYVLWNLSVVHWSWQEWQGYNSACGTDYCIS